MSKLIGSVKDPWLVGNICLSDIVATACVCSLLVEQSERGTDFETMAEVGYEVAEWLLRVREKRLA